MDSALATRLVPYARLLLVLVPMLVTAWGLLPELVLRTPNVNDDSVHLLFIRQASEALSAGRNVFDHWDPTFEAGVPQFLYYQHLPALAVVALERVSLGTLDLLGAFNIVRFVLMVGFPVTVLVAMRWMGFSATAGAFAAAAATLLSSDFRYGFEYESYTFVGFGMFTQLWAMHMALLTVAASYAAIQRGRRVWLAPLLFGAMILTHVVYAYMVAIAIGVIWLWGLRRANVRDRTIRIVVIGGFALAISSYMWLPFLTQLSYLNATPYLQQEKYDSFGAGPILTSLLRGETLDQGRLPVLTVLLGLGLLATALSRARVALVTTALFAVWLVIYFGRPTLGGLVDLLPLGRSLLLHRFIGGVELAIIPLIGLGGALLWQILKPARSPIRLLAAIAVAAVFLTPAMAERLNYYEFNASLKTRTAVAVAADADARTVLARLSALPKGRVFAGLPRTYGQEMALGDVFFYNLLAFNAVEGLPPPNESFSLNSDFIWDFDDADPADYDLWNVRYVVAPATRAMADFLTPILQTPRYTLYSAPTSGYAEYVAIADRRAAATQADLFASNLAWVRGTQPAAREYLRYDYPATSPGGLSTPLPGCPTGGQTDFERFQAGQINLVVQCPAAATLVLKTTYHPNWEVRVDGQPVATFMVSPAFIGISLPAGQHLVDAVYRPTPMKLPLQFLGLTALVILLLARGRLAFRPGWNAVADGRRKLVAGAGLLVSLASLVIVGISVDIEETARLLSGANVGLVGAGLLIFLTGVVARVWIWVILLPSRPDGSRLTSRQVAPVLMLGYLGNTILPARLGEVIRGYIISRREGVPVGGAFGSIALERVIDIATLACLALVAAVTVGSGGWVLQSTAVLAVMGIIVIAVLATAGLRPFLRAGAWVFGRGPLRPIVGAVVGRLERFVHWSGGAHRRRAIVLGVALSAFAWATNAGMNVLLADALGIELGIAEVGLITALGVLATALPSAPAYVGTFELAVVAIAGSLGVAPEAALAFAALSHVVGLIPTLVGGPLSLAWVGLDVQRLAATAREGQAVNAAGFAE